MMRISMAAFVLISGVLDALCTKREHTSGSCLEWYLCPCGGCLLSAQYVSARWQRVRTKGEAAKREMTHI
jgi:hypothetical protein